MTRDTRTVTVDRLADLLPGDVIVDTDRDYDGDLARVRRVLPPEPALPTTQGSIVAQVIENPNLTRSYSSAFLKDGLWWDTTRPADQLYPEKWLFGWHTVYEAPQRSIPTHGELATAVQGVNLPSESFSNGQSLVELNPELAAHRVLDLLNGDKP